jgi:hypothetical protein
LTANLGTSRESLRMARAVETLEQIAKPEARQLLKHLAGGAAGAWLTGQSGSGAFR